MNGKIDNFQSISIRNAAQADHANVIETPKPEKIINTYLHQTQAAGEILDHALARLNDFISRTIGHLPQTKTDSAGIIAPKPNESLSILSDALFYLQSRTQLIHAAIDSIERIG